MYEEKLLSLQCTSVLAPCMADFVEQKRALGNKYNACVEVFNGFDRFCNEQHLEAPVISKELLSLWEEKRPHENETTQLIRISYVRQLCEYLNNNGYEVPGAFHPAPKKSQQFVPYIFTKNELERLFSATDSTKPTPSSPIRHLVMPVLFRLIYTCGLRASAESIRCGSGYGNDDDSRCQRG
jgi:integrase/recombinase XerD